MKIFTLITFIILFAIYSQSCDVDDIPVIPGDGFNSCVSVSDLLGIFYNPVTYNGYFFITSRKYYNNMNEYNIQGYYLNKYSDNEVSSAGELKLDKFTIYPDSTNFYSYSYRYYDSIPRNEDSIITFGKTHIFNLTGNDSINLPEISEEMYLPKDIEILYPEKPDDFIYKSKGFTLKWNQDIYNDTVAIVLSSHFKDKDSNWVNECWYVFENDYGEYIISPDILSKFTTGHSIVISIGRSNEKVFSIGYRKFRILALTEAQKRFNLKN